MSHVLCASMVGMDVTHPRVTLEIRGYGPPKLDEAAVEQARLVRNARNELLGGTGSLTYEMLARGRDASIEATRQWIHRLRRAGRLIVVDAPDTKVVPAFQFDRVLDLRSDTATVVEALGRIGMDEWATWFWMYSPNGWLDSTPLDALDEGRLEDVLTAVSKILPDG